LKLKPKASKKKKKSSRLENVKSPFEIRIFN
jgi:hypothetical protein